MSVEEQATATTFSVPTQKTIPADNAVHKVTVALLEFEPLLHYACVPSKNTAAFLIASAINTSRYPLLAGAASIYFDGAFTARVRLRAVAVGAKFDASLGSDPAVKVRYKPANKYQQHVGVTFSFRLLP